MSFKRKANPASSEGTKAASLPGVTGYSGERQIYAKRTIQQQTYGYRIIALYGPYLTARSM